MKRILITLLLLQPLLVEAVQVTNLYDAKIPVSSRAAVDQNANLTKALQQVLIKVSGNSSIISNPQLQAALAKPETLLQLYSYQEIPAPNHTNQIYLSAQFDAEAVNKLLTQAKLSIWNSDRPQVLVWLIDATGESTGSAINHSEANPLINQIQLASAQRGLPIIFPYNTAQTSQLQTFTIDNFKLANAPVWQELAKLFPSNATLAGRVSRCANMQWCGDWNLYSANQLSSWQNSAAELSLLFQDTTNKVADKLAILNTMSQFETVQLIITGVNSLAECKKVLIYLRHLASVKQVDLINIQGDKVTVEVQLIGGQDAFSKAVSLESLLHPFVDSNAENESTDIQTMSYQWTQ